MFAKNVDLSIRGRMILWSLVASCIITFSSFSTIFFVTHQQMHGRVDEDMDMILSDLEDEYAQYGGLSKKLRACILEDVDEHNIAITQIFVLAPDGRTLFSTQALKNPRHPIRTWSLTLSDGNTIQIKRDIFDLREFDLFLALLLTAIGLISISCVGVFSYFLGGRILKLNQTVQEKNRAIEELKTLTDDIAHDLRTPLTRLNIAAEASFVKGDGLALIEHVSQESTAMLEMIDTMLEISQTSFRIDRTPRETLDLALLVQQSADIYRQLAEDKNITLKVDVPNRSIGFSGHKAKLQQMIGNLLDNALKFTPEGGTIAMALTCEEKGVVLKVGDTGCGIGKDDLPHIFQRFYRADSSRSLPGNGLGLALVHAIVTSYGGRITCHSTLDEGTTFVVQLPSPA